MPIQTERAAGAGEMRAARRRVEQAAHTQSVFREVNENIATLPDLITEAGYNPAICECSDPGCANTLEITSSEYEAIRRDGTHFIVVPGHQQDGIERVVDGNSRFLVVEKLGRAAEIAAADNPRPT